jgi:hypothetical protein
MDEGLQKVTFFFSISRVAVRSHLYVYDGMQVDAAMHDVVKKL